MVTWTARGGLNVRNLATGEENALPAGITHKVLVVEAHSPQDTHTAPTDPVTEPTLILVQSSNVFDEEVADITQVHCDSKLFAFELSTSPPSREIFVETSNFGSILEPLDLLLTL